MTIVEAAREAIRRHGSPMTVEEILQRINADNLFAFKASKPRSVLKTQIRRHCVGIDTRASSDRKVFQEQSSGRYDIA